MPTFSLRRFSPLLIAFCLLPCLFAGRAGAQTVVSSFGQFYNQGNPGTGHNATTRKRHTFPLGTTGFYLVYSNSCSSSTITGTITITASIELNNGYNTFIPVYFGGNRSVTIAAGGVVRSDYISFNVNPGAYIWSRTFVTDSGSGRPANWLGDASQGDIVQEGTDDTAPINADNMVATAGASGYVPVCVVGFPVITGKPSIIGVGDSITAGQGDLNGSNFQGYFTRAMGLTLPFVKIAQGGEQITNQIGPSFGAGNYNSSWFQRFAMVQYANDALVMIGANNLGSITTSALQIGWVQEWVNLSQAGTKVYACTLVPYTTSTDGFATTANQSAYNTNSATVRLACNDWLRDGAPVNASLVPVATGTATAGTLRMGMPGHPLTNYFDTADAVESSRNSGTWKVPGYTADGVHPSSAGAAAMAAAVPLSQFAAPTLAGGTKRRIQ